MLSNQPINPNEPKAPFFLWRPFVAFWRWLAPPTLADRDRQSSSSRLTGIAIVVLLGVGLSITALLYARPIYNACQDWYATRLVKEARSLADQGEVISAIMISQRAYNLSPENLGAIRLNAEFFTRLKRTEALYFWDKLGSYGALTPEDEQQRIRALVHADRNKEARQELDAWMTRNAPQEETLRLAKDVYGDGDFRNALLGKLKTYAAHHPEDRQSQLRLAGLQIDSGSPTETGEALALLWKLAAGTDAISLSALDMLSGFPVLAPEDTPRLIEKLTSHPRSTPQQQVKAYQLRMRQHPEQRLAIITEAVRHFQDTKREELLQVVSWLVSEKEFQQVLTLVDEDAAVTHQPLLENYLTCLTALNRFEDLRRLVNDPRVNALLTRANAAFYQLHLAFVTRQPLTELRARMETATLHAEQEGRMEMLLSIGQYGELRSMPDLAEPAYRASLRSRRTFIQALEGLLRATQLSGNTVGHLNALRDAAKQWPDNQDYQENLVYLHLLTGLELETSLERATTLARARPSDATTQLLAAMAGWRFRDLASAQKHLSVIDATQLPPGQRIVFAVIERAVGESEAARKTLLSIPADAVMFPQERALFATSQ